MGIGCGLDKTLLQKPSTALRPRALRPQLKHDPLGGGWTGVLLSPVAYRVVEVAPGPHRVSSPTGENEGAVSLDAVADSIYFVKVWPRMGFFSAHSGMERMNAAEARAGIATARMVPSTWPGRPLREQP